jgi:hypothetical protein
LLDVFDLEIVAYRLDLVLGDLRRKPLQGILVDVFDLEVVFFDVFDKLFPTAY